MTRRDRLSEVFWDAVIGFVCRPTALTVTLVAFVIMWLVLVLFYAD